MQLSRLVRAWFVLLCCFAMAALGQCDPDWGTANALPPLTGSARCSAVWDPDGAGPLEPRLYVGGSNLLGGGTAGARVAIWDGASWSDLGTGPGTTGAVTSLTVWNGTLIAGGTFGGGGLDHIAAWDGAAWQPLGSGSPSSVNSLTVWNGLLVAVGTAPFSTTALLQTWNGSTWATLPNPPALDVPWVVTTYQGQLCVGGLRVTPANGVIERWNGSSWATSILAGGTNAEIKFLAVRPSLAVGGADTLYAGGRFTSLGGAAVVSLASTTGGTSFGWSAVGNNSNTSCTALLARSAGLTGFTVTAGFASPVGVYHFSSTTGAWTTLGNPSVNSLCTFGGSLHVTHTGSSTACSRWDGAAWIPVAGAGLSGEVRALAALDDDVVVGGTFQSTSNQPLNRVARWDGSVYRALGTGMTGTSVDALVRRTNGDVVAGGSFTAAGGAAANNVANWNGSAWSPLGTGTDQPVLALCELPNGDVVAGGSFATAGGVACSRIARWNGVAWSPIAFGMNGDVRAFAVRSDGTLFAGGSFTAAGIASCSRIARWNGSAWQPLGAGCNGDVHALAFRPNGDLVAVGAFTSAGGVAADRCAIWNGVAWSATASASGDPTPARAVCVLPDGDVVAGRGFHQPGVAADGGISRWNGSTWSGFGPGVASSPPGSPVNVRAIVQRPDGSLVVGGDFAFAGALTSRWLARLTPTCPALASAYGTGCSSTAGPLTLTADTLPWIGAPFRTTTTGVAANSLCIGLIGLAQIAIPLDQLIGGGQPGCTLLTSLDILLPLANGPGTATSAFALNPDPALVGVPFFQQTIPFEFDALGALVAIRGSNALAATIGSL